MHKKSILILVAVTFLTFFSCLFNDFVGDDGVVIQTNKFYASLSNFPLLFSSQYITQDKDIVIYSPQQNSSGSIAYRPVLSTTYFLDYASWKLNPFGYHLNNLIVHVINTVLVYFLLWVILENGAIAFFAALLFGVHPIQAEVVCNIGYRADLLACFFSLLSLWAFFGFKKFRGKYVLSWMFYFLAVFSKESAIVLPLIMILWSRYIKNIDFKTMIQKESLRYLGFLAVALFYLYVYFIVFPNSTLGSLGYLGGGLFTHVLTVASIFAQYLKSLAWPPAVNIIPPLYAPRWYPGAFPEIGVVISLFFVCFYRARKVESVIVFFMFWFLVALLPVANIFPLANPMAYRFLYFPSIGFFVLMAFGLERFILHFSNKVNLSRLLRLVPFTLVGLCVVTTIPLTMYWKNNHTAAKEMIEHYPRNAKGYSILAIDDFKRGRCEEAVMNFHKASALGEQNALNHFLDGICLANLNDTAEAIIHFQKAVSLSPYFASPYIALGRIYFLRGDDQSALIYLEKSLELLASYSTYGYLIQIYLKAGREREAQSIWQKAQGILKNPDQLKSLEKLLSKQDLTRFPIDLGI